MLDCAGGILRNEGPLAFYKVGSETTSPHYFLTVRKKLGHIDSVAGYRSLRFDPIWRSRIYQAPFRCTKPPKWERGCSAKFITAAGRRSSRGTGQRICLWTGRTHTDTCVTSRCMHATQLPKLSCSGLQTQSNTNPVYRGPFDAIKKIGAKYGIRGIYKGQNVTFLREATGYGVYFWAYETLVQREMAQKGIRREQISPGSAILYGAAAGYAVSGSLVHIMCTRLIAAGLALGCDISYRYG